MSYNTPNVCRYYRLGKCTFGDRCWYSHSGRNPISTPKQSEQAWTGHCYYIPLPKKISGSVAAGKSKRNFRRIEEGMLPHKVLLLSSGREVEVTLLWSCCSVIDLFFRSRCK